MTDPFEVRMRFTSQLQHLSASSTSATKTANYAVKYAEFADDLHSCILEQLERSNMNNRANIMYFLPSLCDAAEAQGEPAYGRMMERDILRIIDLVAPDEGRGAANVKVVRRVLKVLEGKGFLRPQTVVELEECIAGRDDALGGSSPSTAVATAAPDKERVTATAHPATVRSTPHSTGRDPSLYHPAVRLDKRQIEQRIEEDRERHKRAREGIWAIPQKSVIMNGAGVTGMDAEVGKMWHGDARVMEDDLAVAREYQAERKQCLEFEDG